MDLNGNQSLGTQWTWAMMEPEPTDIEQALYEKFIVEYLRDKNFSTAASRVGFQAAFAYDMGKMLLQKSYVQKRIKQLEEDEPDLEAERREIKRLLLRKMREIVASPFSKPNEASNAGKALRAMYGFDAPPPKHEDPHAQAGVMLVPAIANLDEWEKAATASQTALAEASRVA